MKNKFKIKNSHSFLSGFLQKVTETESNWEFVWSQNYVTVNFYTVT